MSRPNQVRSKPHLWDSHAQKFENQFGLNDDNGLMPDEIRHIIQVVQGNGDYLNHRIARYALGIGLDGVTKYTKDLRRRRIMGSVIAQSDTIKKHPSESVLDGNVRLDAPTDAYQFAILNSLSDMRPGEQILADVALKLEKPANDWDLNTNIQNV